MTSEVVEVVDFDLVTPLDKGVEPVLVILECLRAHLEFATRDKRSTASCGVIGSRSSLIGHFRSKGLSVVNVGWLSNGCDTATHATSPVLYDLLI